MKGLEWFSARCPQRNILASFCRHWVEGKLNVRSSQKSDQMKARDCRRLYVKWSWLLLVREQCGTILSIWQLEDQVQILALCSTVYEFMWSTASLKWLKYTLHNLELSFVGYDSSLTALRLSYLKNWNPFLSADWGLQIFFSFVEWSAHSIVLPKLQLANQKTQVV